MKTYKCPYCNIRLIRPKLISHINKQHAEMIPEGYNADRLVYDIINPNGGRCRVCKNPTAWNFKQNRYEVLCSNSACKQKLRDEYKKNMLRVKGTYNILNDPEQQKLMLANRRISGIYKHSDGGEIHYTGQYERAFLEFIDSFMQIPSDDILSPGPTMEYMYNGQKHIYIPDFYIISLNLIIEIKDGGDNLNGKRTPGMIASREKTIEKEKVITDRGEYNYVRLTNNEFVQFVDVVMAMKEKAMNDDESRTVRIHESVNTLHESPSYTDLPQKVIDFNRKMNMYEYILPNHGNIIINVTAYDYCYKYYYLTVKEFEKYNGGVCWDYVRYQHYYFNKYLHLPHKCYYVVFKDGKTDPTHTFMIFSYKGKYYWFESSWKRHIGIFGYNTEREALLGVCNELCTDCGAISKLRDFYISVYDPEAIPSGISCEEFMDWQDRNISKYPISMIKTPIFPFIRINTDQELPSMEESIYDPRESNGDIAHTLESAYIAAEEE